VNSALDTLAYGNRLRGLPPWQKIGLGVTAICISLCSHWPIHLLLGCWLVVWTVVYAGIPWRFYSGLAIGVVSFLAAGLPGILINFAPTHAPIPSLWSWSIGNGQLYISPAAVAQAIDILSRSVASTTALFFIVLTTPFSELAVLLDRLGLPSILTELLLLCYRFIFLFAAVAGQIAIAQTSRGGYRTRRLALRSVSLLIRQLIQRTAHRYQQLTLSIKARGFEREFRFWQSTADRYSPRYGNEAIGGCLALIIGEILYRIYLTNQN
jgi:cobalt/nickel transport system permease protein